MSLTLRPAASADFDFARETHHLAYRDVVLRQFGNWDDALQDRLFQKNWQEGPFEILLYSGAPCGYAAVDYKPDKISIRELVLRPEYQGKGLGTQFLQNLFTAASARCIPIHLQVLKANHARQLYARLGFRETGTDETHIIMEWNTPN
jgi:ribosomal protein S18 acetylase RimI-like enzyme